MQNQSVLQAAKQGPCEPEKLYSQKELAPILGKSEAWFERARWNGNGPAFVKIGRSPRYQGATVNAWLAGKTCSNTGQGA